MSDQDQNLPATSPSEVFSWFRQGAGFGMFIGIAAGIITQAHYWECVVGGVIAGVVIWPMLAALLSAVASKRGPVAGTVRFCGGALAGLILVAFIASFLLILGLKIYFDFFIPEPTFSPTYIPPATVR